MITINADNTYKIEANGQVEYATTLAKANDILWAILTK
jgi:hypothetical protein